MQSLEPRRAVFLMNRLPPKSGGEIYADHLHRHARAHGWEIEYLEVERLREETRARLARSFGWLPPALLSVLTALSLARQLWRLRGLLVEDQEYSVSLFITNLLLLLRWRGRILTISHHLPDYESTRRGGPWQRFLRWKYKLALSLSAAIVTVSEYSKREIESLGIEPGRIMVLPPGLDRAQLAVGPRPVSDGFLHVTIMGNIAPRKGTIHLVQAFAALDRPDVQLHVVGAPAEPLDYYAQVKRAVEESGVAERVHFHGRLEMEAMGRLLSKTDIFVVPSLQEGFGMVVIEAMHYGLPVITTNVTALPELVRDGVNGLLVPPADVLALTAALQRLMDDSKLRTSLGCRGRQGIEGRFEWETTCRGFEDVMRRMLQP